MKSANTHISVGKFDLNSLYTPPGLEPSARPWLNTELKLTEDWTRQGTQSQMRFSKFKST